MPLDQIMYAALAMGCPTETTGGVGIAQWSRHCKPIRRRWTLVIVAVLVLNVGLCGNPDTSAAQPLIGTVGEWRLGCKFQNNNRPNQCALIQSVRAQDATDKFAMAILTQTVARNLELKVVVPLGVEFDNGVNLNVDGVRQATVKLKACDLSGCFGRLIIEHDLSDTLRKGKRLTLQVRTSDEEAYGLPFALEGLGQALDEMRRHINPSYSFLSELRPAIDSKTREYALIVSAAEAPQVHNSCPPAVVKVQYSGGNGPFDADLAKILRDYLARCGGGDRASIRVSSDEATADAVSAAFRKEEAKLRQIEDQQRRLATQLYKLHSTVSVAVRDLRNIDAPRYVGVPPLTSR